jgi:hypothetical protein
LSPRIVGRRSREGRDEVEILQFACPSAELRTHVVRDADGAVLDIRCERWAISIGWYGDDGDCECFEYRQYFMAPPIRVQPPTAPDVEIYSPIGWERNGDEWCVIQRYPPNQWIEDTNAVLARPGVVRRYGYRTDDRTRPPGEFASDGYDTPWKYTAIDEPHFYPGGMYPPGTRFVIDVAFKGAIVNVCDNRTELETQPWWWRFDGA